MATTSKYPREHARVSLVEADIACVLLNYQKHRAHILNLSEGGALVELSAQLEQRQYLSIRIDNIQPMPIYCKARVIHDGGGITSNQGFVYGFRFQDLNEDDKKRLRGYVAHLLKVSK